MSQIRKVQGFFSWVVILSEVSHVFCCVLPSAFSILTLMVGLGMIGVTPLWMESMHEVMHGWEIPLITFSGVIVLMGWGIHHIAKKIDCHDTGCAHGGCKPKKKNALKILKIATALFVINVVIYVTVHMPTEVTHLH